MCDEADEDCLAALKFILDWIFASKMFENFMMIYSLMMIYSFFMKNLVKSHFLLMKWIFLVQILIKLSLKMMIIL